MPRNFAFNQTLNKFNLKILVSLFFLILMLLPGWTIELRNQINLVEAIVSPQAAFQGDTVSIKIKKIQGEDSLPKVYFEKSKVPIFMISNEYFRTLLPITANQKVGEYPLEVFYNGQVKKTILTVKEKKYPLQDLTLPKETEALKASKIEKILVGKALETITDEKFWTGKFIYPSNGPQSTGYGVKRRVNGVINIDYFHKGLDFASRQGSNVIAPEKGKIVLARTQANGFVVNGNCIFVDHGHGVVTGYLHLSKILVKEGDTVKKGQIIGKVGSTGIASGPHLHWGVYVLGKTVDPINWTNMSIE